MDTFQWQCRKGIGTMENERVALKELKVSMFSQMGSCPNLAC